MHERMNEFLVIAHGMNIAESTVNEYRKGLEMYSDWLAREGIDPLEVTVRDIKRYLGYLNGEMSYAPNTVRLKYAAVSKFYEDVVDDREMEEDPTERIDLVDYAKKTTRMEEETKEKRVWLSQEEIKALVENVPAPSLRNRLVVMMQYYTGLRRQELADIKLSDIDREEREVKVRGKRDKINTAHWQPRMDGLLSAWLDQGYRDASPYAKESDYLFLTESSPQISGSRINDIVKIAAENAGTQEVLYEDAAGKSHHKVTSHTLRHSFAMHYLENGGSIEGLSKLFAHSSVTTTEIYGEILDERAKEEYEQFAPQIDL